MRRKSLIPYGETSILSLSNMTYGTKFQFTAKVRKINQMKIVIADDHDELEIDIDEEVPSDLKIGETIIVFGEKLKSGFKKEKIVKLRIEWDLYTRTRDLELR
ncbi:MAG: hypothetical protein ACXAC8_00555 [Candidatus Hodarchaeales archaeon]|jgi:hypothetical protein